MLRTGIYARYSDDQQRATSIEDQLRRCRETAGRLGLKVDDGLIWSDAAITGTAKGTAKRPGYRRLQDAIEARVIDVLIVDEVSRLTRSPAEGGRLMELFDALGIRIVTADGIDSDREGWKMLWMLKLTTSTHEVDATSHRAKRGMLGQLERGYQIAQPPFGYNAIKDVTPGGRALGTRWVINTVEADVVRLMYRLRIDGYSGAQIAELLNREHPTPPGQHRKDAATYWRAATVLRLLANPIYRGVFVWNGSSFTKAKAKRRRKPVEEIAFPRPALRLVSDDDWFKANPGFDKLYTRTYSPRGGGKSLFSGLVRCGLCSAMCSPGTGHGAGSLYCPQCESAVRTGGRENWIGYSSVAAAKEALRWTLHLVFGPGAVRDALSARLTERLLEGPSKELGALKGELAQVEERLARVKRLMLSLASGEEQFASDYEALVKSRSMLMARLTQAQARTVNIDAKVVEAQHNVDAVALIDRLLSGGTVEAFKVKATLRRMLSRFEFVERPRRGTSVFIIGLRPGVLLAEAAGTVTVDHTEVVFRVTVSTTARRPVVWTVHAEPCLPGEAPDRDAAVQPPEVAELEDIVV